MLNNDYSVLINGRLRSAASRETSEVVNPSNGKVIAQVPKCSVTEIEEAADAAWTATSAWAGTSTADRAKIMMKLADVIRENEEDLAKLETAQYGGPLFKTSNFDIPFSSELLDYYAGVGRGTAGMTLNVGPSCRAMTVKEPLGVVGLITPWNFLLVTVLAKVAPALITGNTCVVKPPSCAPLTALKLGEMAVEAGLPAGVLNIVTGPGSIIGEALVGHPRVAKINFTGDSATGKRIMELASTFVKPVASELGGKNAFIVMPDADLKATVEGAIWGAFFNSGQNCGAASRYLVHKSVYDEFKERFVAAARQIIVGDPTKPDTMMGPVAYKGHRDAIEGYVERALSSGSELLLGGSRPDSPETRNGFFVSPTIFGNCDPQSELMQEEVFGPVVGLASFKDAEEAIAITNDTRYGLCASIWTQDIRQGLRMINRLQLGTVWLNQHLAIVFEIPWGGCKESGWSKENSTMAMDEYMMSKHIWIDLEGSPNTPWQGRVG